MQLIAQVHAILFVRSTPVEPYTDATDESTLQQWLAAVTLPGFAAHIASLDFTSLRNISSLPLPLRLRGFFVPKAIADDRGSVYVPDAAGSIAVGLPQALISVFAPLPSNLELPFVRHSGFSALQNGSLVVWHGGGYGSGDAVSKASRPNAGGRGWRTCESAGVPVTLCRCLLCRSPRQR